MNEKLDLTHLRAVAEAATPGEWHQAETGVLGAREDWDLGKGPARIMVAQMPWRRERMEANAKHVAAFDPPTVLALLARLEQAEHGERAAKSELQDVVNEAIRQKKRAINAEQQVARVLALVEDFNSNGNSRELGDPTANTWHDAARQILRALGGEQGG